MELYRITQEIFSEDLSGNGSKLFGGRWNSEGIPALYAASSRSLALLETLAHTPGKMLQVKTYVLVTLSIPDSAMKEMIELTDLPENWDAVDIHPFTQRTGDNFLRENKKLMLSVPSVLMPEENIFVLNPLHTDMRKVKITGMRKIHFDKRVENHL